MASGLAVIGANAGGVGANAGGVGEIIRPMNNGLHFEARSVESLTRKIETLQTNQALREQLQRNGRKFAFQQDWKPVIHDLLGIYRAVIDIETKHRMSV